MTFFYNLNKKLDEIRATPELTHKQLNERDMSRAAKVYEKYGKQGMEALAKAGREGKDLDPVRNKYDKYDDKSVDEGMEQLVQRIGGIARKAKKLTGNTLDKLTGGSDADQIRDLQRKMGLPQTGLKPGDEPNPKIVKEVTAPIDFDKVLDAIAALYGDEIWDNDAMQDLANDLEQAGPTERELDFIIAKGKLPKRLAGIQFSAGDNVQFGEGSSPMSPKQKSFAALAPPTDKITFADKIAGAKKEVDEMLGDVAAEAMKSALSGGQKKLDKNNNGKLDANDFAMLRKGGGKKSMGETQGATTYTVAYKDSTKPGKQLSTQVKATSAAEAKLAFHEIDDPNGRFTYLGSRPDVDEVLETDDDNPFTSWKKPRAEKPRVGSIERGHKHDIEHTATGRKVTRRVDDQGNSVGADDTSDAEPQKRGRGRPKSTGGPRQERTTANARKSDRTAHGQSGFAKSKKTNEGDEEGGDVKQAMALLKKAGYKVSKAADGAEQVDEKAVSKKQQKFMGMVHAAQKGEKPASKEVGKVAKTMKKGDAEDFASTKHKGLPEKAPKKKEKEVEESSTTAGSVATSGSNSSAKGMTFGKGIYDSFNRDLETMISESMSINMSNSTEGGKSLTITASDEDAVKLATLLKSAGLGGGGDQGYGGSGYQSACGCGTPNCSCGDSEVDEAYGDTQPTENQPDYPTNQEGAQDNFEYSGGLNKPKSTGQSTVPVLASQEERQESYAAEEEDAIKRMMEMAGVKKKEVDEEKTEEGNLFTKGLADDNIKVGEKIPGTNSVKKKDIDESILAATANLWSEYKGQYGV
jgi:hypothetical protein